MSRNAPRQRLLLAGVLVGASLSFARDWRGIAMINDSAGRVMAPVTTVATNLRDATSGMLATPGEVRTLRQRLQELERENAELKIGAAKLGDVTRENVELRELLEFKRARVDLNLVGASVEASVIAREPGALLHGLWIDVGRADGVAEKDPVASHRGLVGRVVVANERSAQVQLIVDAGSAVGGRIERSQATGMLVGSPGGGLLLRYLPQDVVGQPAVVERGDLVYTSGLAGAMHFPRMIPIGQVVEVLQSDERPTQEAVVRPFVDPASLDLVMVITDWRPDPDASPREQQSDQSGES